MAYVKRHGNKWQYTISCTTEGKTKLIKKGGFLSKEDAQAEAIKHEAQIRKQYGENFIINRLRKPKINSPKKVLNEKEYEQLYEELFNNLNNGLGYYILLLNLTTGIRYSEAVALTFEDFDFNNDTINIYKTWEQNGKIFPYRSLSSSRIITVDKAVMNRFKDLFKTKITNNMDLVFCYPKNKYKVISKQAIEILLKGVLLNLNIEPVNANNLRHTHASILLSKGLPIQYVSERLGHNSIDATNKILQPCF
ncbi:tyrosine-type recombinase/integrase [Virgibacillus sp. FSP13]